MLGGDVTVGPRPSAVNEALIAALASAAELHLSAFQLLRKPEEDVAAVCFYQSSSSSRASPGCLDPSFCWEWMCVQKTTAAGRSCCSLFMCQKASPQVKHARGETDCMEMELSKMEIRGNRISSTAVGQAGFAISGISMSFMQHWPMTAI